MRRARAVVELCLAPLDEDAVDRLTADALHAAVDEARPFARLLYEKTGGNPFFIKELLRTLYEDGAIAFDPDGGRWRWDLAAARAAKVSASVVEFILANLRRLPEATQQALQLAACIGNTFDLGTLAIIAQRTPAVAASDLGAALSRQMVVPDRVVSVSRWRRWRERVGVRVGVVELRPEAARHCLRGPV